MANKNVEENLTEAMRLIQVALAELGGVQHSEQKSPKKALAIVPQPQSLPEHIIALRNGGFFKEAQTIAETHTKLEKVYPCEEDRVTTALKRLLDRRELRKINKKVKEKNLTAYVW